MDMSCDPVLGKTYSLCLTLFAEISYTSGEFQTKNCTWHVMFTCSHLFSFDILYSLLVFLKRSRTGNKHKNLGDILTNSGLRLNPEICSESNAKFNQHSQDSKINMLLKRKTKCFTYSICCFQCQRQCPIKLGTVFWHKLICHLAKAAK